MTRPRLILLIRCAVLAVACWGLHPYGLAWLPLALMMPPSILGGGTITHSCNSCNANTAHDQYQVVITGVVSGATHPSCPFPPFTCATDWNQTFLFTYAYTTGGFCTYQASVSICSTCSSPITTLEMGINQGFSMVPLSGDCGIVWTENALPNPRDCSTPTAITIPFSGNQGAGICDGSASTFTVVGI